MLRISSYFRCKLNDKITHLRHITQLSSAAANRSTARLGERPNSAKLEKKVNTVKIERFLSLNRYYNPAVLRAYREFNIRDTNNKKLIEIYRSAERMLMFLESDNRGKKRAIANRYYTPSIESARRTAGELSFTVFEDIKTDKELIALSSFMAILMPKSERVWFLFDENLSLRLEEYSLDSVVLSAHAIISTKFNLKLDNKFKTPNLVATRIFSTTKLSLIHESVIEELPSDNLSLKSEGSLKCVNSKLFEQLALYLQILSVIKPEDPYQYGSKKNANPDKKNLEKVAEEIISLLSRNTEPVKFQTLQGLWLNAPSLDLPNSYQLYKALYDQIYRSISTEPKQIIDEEDAIYSLFESMKLAKFKNGKLVKEISNILDIHGFNLEFYGMKLFGILVELDCIPFATKILTDLLNAPNITVN